MAEDDDGPGYRFVSEKDNQADLAARIRPEERALYDSFGHIHQGAAFFNRRYVIVQTKGKSGGRPRAPLVLGAVRVIDFRAEHDKGCLVVLQDEASSRTLQIGHVPTKIFRWPLFASVPINQGLKWEARENPDGSYSRKLVFGLCFKQQSAIKWFNPDNVAILTHNEFTQTFEGVAQR